MYPNIGCIQLIFKPIMDCASQDKLGGTEEEANEFKAFFSRIYSRKYFVVDICPHEKMNFYTERRCFNPTMEDAPLLTVEAVREELEQRKFL